MDADGGCKRQCPTGDTCGDWCGQWDDKRNQCSHVVAADALTRIAEAAEWLRALKQREAKHA